MRPNREIPFIGITGGVGAGKSEILAYIRTHYKCEIYLADEVAHQIKLPGTECYEKLRMLLGEDVLEKDGTISNVKMAGRIFADKSLLEQVNALVHPAVRSFLLDRYAQAKEQKKTELFFVEAALLIEAGYREVADELWYIYADQQVRKKRLKENRGYSEERIARIMANQLSEEEFRRSCDFVIDNSGTLEESYRQIDRKLEAYKWQE